MTKRDFLQPACTSQMGNVQLGDCASPPLDRPEYRCLTRRTMGVKSRKAAIRAHRQLFIDGHAEEVELYGHALSAGSAPIDS